MTTIAQNLLRARKKASLTQAALAQRCGIAQPNIAAFERGVRPASLSSLRRLAHGLGLPLEALLKEPGRDDQLSRFDFEKIAQDLAHDQPNKSLDQGTWQDLQTVFHPKLRALYPSSRRKPRISAAAAMRRIKSLHGPSFLERIDGRFSKLNVGKS
jgi:transcriptional regulator with XRE-family HTH domain